MKFFVNRHFTRKKILRSKNNKPPAFRQKGRGFLLFVNFMTNIIAGKAGKMQNFGVILSYLDKITRKLLKFD